MEQMGYRNIKLVQELAAQGRITTKRGETKSFDPMQFSMLLTMASETYDWPLDAAAKKNDALPRTYKRGWLHMAQELGMALPEELDEIEVIGNEPRAPKKELKAMQRLSLTAKKLESAGLITCLRKGSPQKRNNAVWLLTIGSPEENAEVESYVKARLFMLPH